MRRKFQDPMTALSKRDPELVRLIHHKTQDAFRRYERATLPIFHVDAVVQHLHDEDERSIQIAIAERVCQKRPEIMQRRPKRFM